MASFKQKQVKKSPYWEILKGKEYWIKRLEFYRKKYEPLGYKVFMLKNPSANFFKSGTGQFGIWRTPKADYYIITKNPILPYLAKIRSWEYVEGDLPKRVIRSQGLHVASDGGDMVLRGYNIFTGDEDI